MSQINYRQLNEQIRMWQNPDQIALSKSFSDELGAISYSEVLTFVRLAMNGVDPLYTQKSKDAGERVKNHLIDGGLKDVDFEYQGSVMTNTHIKGYSDIDLLTISNKFYSGSFNEVDIILDDYYKKQQYASNQMDALMQAQNRTYYLGNSKEDLKKLRNDSEIILGRIYSICETRKPKSIKIKNTHLNREVDIVIANWYDDVRSIVNNKGHFRGIQIYNKELQVQGSPDYPFLSISRINERSAETGGRLKKMIRFLKNVKAKTEGVQLSSYDFNAICYDIDKSKYHTLSYYELVPIIYQQLYNIGYSEYLADNLTSVDECEFIFRGKPEKVEHVRKLLKEVQSIITDLKAVIRL